MTYDCLTNTFIRLSHNCVIFLNHFDFHLSSDALMPSVWALLDSIR